MKYVQILLLVVLSHISFSVFSDDSRDWLTHFVTLSEDERLAEIEAVSQLPVNEQKYRLPALLVLLGDYSQPVRIQVAEELAELGEISQQAIPVIIFNNFQYQTRDEGNRYVEAITKFGDSAVPELRKALNNEHWLVRERACTALEKIQNIHSIASCSQVVMK